MKYLARLVTFLTVEHTLCGKNQGAEQHNTLDFLLQLVASMGKGLFRFKRFACINNMELCRLLEQLHNAYFTDLLSRCHQYLLRGEQRDNQHHERQEVPAKSHSSLADPLESS